MQALYAQLLVGLINGSFYALLSLGLAVIFGMLNIINFAHGEMIMLGAYGAYFLSHSLHVDPLLSLPLVALGLLLGNRVHIGLSPLQMQRLIGIILLVSGTSLLWRAWV